jgi:hypothetical protein
MKPQNSIQMEFSDGDFVVRSNERQDHAADDHE